MNVTFICWAIFLAVCPVQAALLSPADRENIEQQQRDLLQQQQIQRDELEKGQTVYVPPSASADSGDQPCFTISTINIQQDKHLSSGDENALTKIFIGKCLGIHKITQLVQEVSGAYIHRGYITSRAFLPEQDLSRGELNITVMEGKLEEIQLDKRSNRILAMAFPGLKGKIPNLRDIEQGMEQINRPRQTSVQIEILPAAQPVYSIVNLTPTQELPLSAGIGFDNGGQKSTGTGQLLFGGTLEISVLNTKLSGTLSAQQDLTFTSNSLHLNQGGQLLAGRKLDLTASTLNIGDEAKGAQGISQNLAPSTSTKTAC